MTAAVSLAQLASTGVSPGFKNRIINGAMTIDQRNNGASVGTGSGTTVFCVDRFQFIYDATNRFTIQRNAGSVTPPAGFKNYLGVTSSGANPASAAQAFLCQQVIEGFNVADLEFGTANAKTVTLSFWVRSSLTGLHAGSLENSGNDRSYVYTYTVSAANTWEYKTITVAGDTTGSWAVDNAAGLKVRWNLGCGTNFIGTAGTWNSGDRITAAGAVSVVGTNGATFYITGVQLEVGSTATSFDYRPYGTELALCERYFQVLDGFQCGAGDNTSNAQGSLTYKTTMRASPTLAATTITLQLPATSEYTQSSANVTILGSGGRINNYGVQFNMANFTSLATRSYLCHVVGSGSLTASAEL